MAVSIDLSGKLSLVTGSSRGIGRAIAMRLANAGSDVILNASRETEELSDLSHTISQRYGVRCVDIAADVGNSDDVSRMYRQIFGEFKRLDILVNNAGILRDSLIGMIPRKNIDETLATNVVGTLNTIQGGVKLMQRSGGGSIINIASIIGVYGNAGQMLYGASKGAVITATKSAAKELANSQIRVNAIAPGYIDTDMIRDIPVSIHEERLGSIKMGRIGKAEEVADAALFLASPLSAYITGVVIGVDGGMLI